MREHRDPFLRRVGEVIYSYYTSAYSSVRWNLCGNIQKHQQQQLET